MKYRWIEVIWRHAPADSWTVPWRAFQIAADEDEAGQQLQCCKLAYPQFDWTLLECFGTSDDFARACNELTVLRGGNA